MPGDTFVGKFVPLVHKMEKVGKNVVFSFDKQTGTITQKQMRTSMDIRIPRTEKKRVVIVGGGFAGIKLVNKIDSRRYQIVLIDRNNYHQFPPLLYQVASGGLEPGSICFPFRKLFHREKDFYFRMADVQKIVPEENRIVTSIGDLDYDYLILAGGTTTNYYGNRAIEEHALPMKEVREALTLRTSLLLNLENALDDEDKQERRSLLNVVIVGGGATGVEIAGAIAEMKRFIVPKDYPDLETRMHVYLIEGTDRLLGVMSESASRHAKKYLEDMRVRILLGKLVTDFRDGAVVLNDGQTISTQALIWVSGVTAVRFEGIPKEKTGRGGRILVDAYNRLVGSENIFVVGDLCLQVQPGYPNGHPQVAQVAIQQGRCLAHNLNRIAQGKTPREFHYKDYGTMATVGRNKAVADFGKVHVHGFFAWAMWLVIHLRSILGVRNKLAVLLDWMWNYLTYDHSSRFIFFRPKKDETMG